MSDLFNGDQQDMERMIAGWSSLDPYESLAGYHAALLDALYAMAVRIRELEGEVNYIKKVELHD